MTDAKISILSSGADLPKKNVSSDLYPELRSDRKAKVINPGAILFENSPPPKFPDSVQDSGVDQVNMVITLPPPEKPKIARPEFEQNSSQVVRALILSRFSSDHLVKEIMDGVTSRLDIECMNYRNFRKDLHQGLEDLENSQKKQESWSTFSQVASYLSSCSSVILGTALTYTGLASSLGIGMILAGTAGLSSQIVKDFGGYHYLASLLTEDKESQRKIELGLEAGTSLMTTLTSIAVGMGITQSVQTGSLLDQLNKFIAISTQLANGGLTLAQAKSQIDQIKSEKSVLLNHNHNRRLKEAIEHEAIATATHAKEYHQSTEVAAKAAQSMRDRFRIAAASA